MGIEGEEVGEVGGGHEREEARRNEDTIREKGVKGGFLCSDCCTLRTLREKTHFATRHEAPTI